MHKVYSLAPDVLRRVAAMYGKQVARFGVVESGYRNASHSFTSTDGERLNFILYKREPGSAELIRRTDQLGRHVAARGLPVRAPVDERIVQAGQRYGSLYNYLPGQTIAWEMYAMKHIKLLGFGLASFHAAAKDAETALPDVETVYEEIWRRVKAYFSDRSVVRAMREKLGFHVELPDVLPLLAATCALPDRQPLHMDFVRSNLLFRSAQTGDMLVVDGVALSGILDLEKAARGHVMFDLARTLAFLLVDCPKPAQKIYKYFLLSGYAKRGGRDVLSEASRNIPYPPLTVLHQLETMFLTYDFYKFLHQNPYESLSDNHHFRRTVSILRERKVVH